MLWQISVLEHLFTCSDGLVVTASASGAVDSGQTNDFKISVHNYPTGRLALNGQCEEQTGKFTCCAIGKYTLQDCPHLGEVDRWPATPKRSGYSI